jgi:hypothetical protein
MSCGDCGVPVVSVVCLWRLWCMWVLLSLDKFVVCIFWTAAKSRLTFSAGVILTGDNYKVSEIHSSPFEVTSVLSILDASAREAGKYSCIAKNSLDVAQAVVRVYSKYNICRNMIRLFKSFRSNFFIFFKTKNLTQIQ